MQLSALRASDGKLSRIEHESEQCSTLLSITRNCNIYDCENGPMEL